MDALDTDVARFLDYLAVERRYSPLTVQRYRQDLVRLGTFAAERGLAAWSAFQPEQLRQFIAREHRAGAAPASLHALLSASRSLFRFLLREGVLNHEGAGNWVPFRICPGPRAHAAIFI